MISIETGLERGRLEILTDSHTLERRPTARPAGPPPPEEPPTPPGEPFGGGGPPLPSRLELIARTLIFDGYLILAAGVLLVLFERARNRD